MKSVVLVETHEYVSVARYSELCVNELALRLSRMTAEFDLSHERKCGMPGRGTDDMALKEFIFCTIDRTINGRIESSARTIGFGDHVITEIAHLRL